MDGHAGPPVRSDHGAQGVDLMPPRELLKGLGRAGAVREIGRQHPLDERRTVLGLHLAEDLAGDRRVAAKAAADEDVESLDGVLAVGRAGTRAASRPISPM